MLKGVSCFGDAVRRDRPVEPGSPNCDVSRTAAQAGDKPSFRLVVFARADGEVRFAEPDAIIVRGEPPGVVQALSDRLDRERLAGQFDMEANQIDGFFRSAAPRPFKTRQRASIDCSASTMRPCSQ